MSVEKKLLPLQADDSQPAGLGRREMLQIFLGAVGAGIAVPGLAADHPLLHHLADPATVGQADAKAAARNWKPEFLDAHQFETLKILAEKIVPGASKARTAEFIDQLLAVDTQASRRSFLNALGAFERQALERKRRPWKALTAAEQDEILTEVAAMPSGKPTEEAWAEGMPILIPKKPPEPIRLTFRDHFDLMKDWIAGAYYSSEIGMRELGWTGHVIHPGFPGCEHPGGHP
jgi:hypothetical protein